MPDPIHECATCAEGYPPKRECPESQRPCGHHCNCTWVNDHCHWCDREFEDETDYELFAIVDEKESVDA